MLPELAAAGLIATRAGAGPDGVRPNLPATHTGPGTAGHPGAGCPGAGYPRAGHPGAGCAGVGRAAPGNGQSADAGRPLARRVVRHEALLFRMEVKDRPSPSPS